MNELTFEGFKQFVNEQNPDEEINHWGGGWSECAVGLYVKSVIDPNGQSVQMESTKFVDEKVPKPLIRCLTIMPIASSKFPTYKQLQQELEKY